MTGALEWNPPSLSPRPWRGGHVQNGMLLFSNRQGTTYFGLGREAAPSKAV